MRQLAAAAAFFLATTAMAQDAPPVEVDITGGSVRSVTAIAVPAMPTAPGVQPGLGRQIAEVIASDLRSTGLFTPLGPDGLGSYSQDAASAPAYATWRSAGAAQLVAGYVEPMPCCSTGSSPRTATSRPTSTSISSTSGARK